MNKSKRVREIMCLSRLEETTNQLDMIVSFLRREDLIDDQTVSNIRNSFDKVKSVHEVLTNLKLSSKLQLLDYEWTLLPHERIRIYIVTDHNQAEFVL